MEGNIAEVRLFGGNFAPRAWAFCHGQTLAISQNTALFSLIGTIYGGDGRTSFMLPNTQSRVVVGAGHGAGLSNYNIGQVGGYETVVLTKQQIPSHTHILINNLDATAMPQVYNDEANSDEPENNYFAQHANGNVYDSATNSSMGATTISATSTLTVSNTGNNLAHSNIQPVQCLHYIICLQGVFPSRN